jgi:hypothetical protein
MLELGLTELAQQNMNEAKMWFDKAIEDYSGYLTENLVHIRVYAALRELGISTDKEKEDNSKSIYFQINNSMNPILISKFDIKFN